ncbi:hypothetical protein DM02DRAFT_633055 [Periconia macrospinosa]|uniref:Uncharacterized protein n=1 Tax=Periconia macrospinosa TaxID=97972 RepID=A0A2V1DAX4_9PLEO|nr:hypothetical protein DM02DRAFT_633055 [Periconia macrospinosa]
MEWTCKLCGLRKFAAKSQLQYHTESVHYIPAEAALGLCELWQEKVAAKEEEIECVFCNEAYAIEQLARVAHLARHMIEIALLIPLKTPEQAIACTNNITTAKPNQNLPLLRKPMPAEQRSKLILTRPLTPPELGSINKSASPLSLSTPVTRKTRTNESSLDESGEESDLDESVKESDSDDKLEVAEPRPRLVEQAEFVLLLLVGLHSLHHQSAMLVFLLDVHQPMDFSN